MIKEKVKKSELFSEISDADCAYLCDHSRTRRCGSGEILFIEGDKGSSIYLVLEGEIELFKSGLDARETVIKTIVRGEIFAEILIFEQDTYPVSARVKNESILLEIKVNVIQWLLEGSDFRAHFIAGLFKKMRHLTERIIFLSSLAVEDRFFGYLIDRFGKKNQYTITVQKQDIAREIGTVPETFSRMINRLKEKGISWQGEALTFPEDFWKSRTLVD